MVVTYFGLTKAIPFQHHFTLEAAFKSANNIKPDSFVRIAGVNVGKVTDVKPMGKGVNQGAVVSMEIEDKGLPIHIDATRRSVPGSSSRATSSSTSTRARRARPSSATATRSRSRTPARRCSWTRS